MSDRETIPLSGGRAMPRRRLLIHVDEGRLYVAKGGIRREMRRATPEQVEAACQAVDGLPAALKALERPS